MLRNFLLMLALCAKANALTCPDGSISNSKEFNCGAKNPDPENCFHSKHHFELHSSLEYVDLYAFVYRGTHFYVIYETNHNETGESNIHWDRTELDEEEWEEGGTQTGTIPVGTRHIYVSNDRYNSTGYFKNNDESGLILVTKLVEDNDNDNKNKKAYTITGDELKVTKVCEDCIDNAPDSWITPIFCGITKQWYSISGEYFYTSKDLIHWTNTNVQHLMVNSELENTFVEEFFPIAANGDKNEIYYVLYVRDYTLSRSYYYVFKSYITSIKYVTGRQRLDYGPDFHELAITNAATFGQNEILAVGTIGNVYANQSNEKNYCWSNSATVPRYYTLVKKGNDFILHQRPLFPTKSLRKETKTFNNEVLTAESALFKDIKSKSFKITAKITGLNADIVGLDVLKGDNYQASVTFARRLGRVCLDRSESKSPSFNADDYLGKYCAPDVQFDYFEFYLFVDGLIVELIAFEYVSITAVVFSTVNGKGIAPRLSPGGKATLEKFEIQLY